MPLGTLHFGGPDCPPRALRNLLQHHVDNSPAGASISWCTYYFRDQALADSLIRASDRGVEVTLTMEGSPRLKNANDQVIHQLAAHGLNGGLRIFAPRGPVHPHLHAKIYAFSGHRPIAFIGSFNPSGNEPEDANVIAEIGDQDRGHNLLLGIEDPVIAAALFDHAGRVPRTGGLITSRFAKNHVVASGTNAVFFYPRLRSGQIENELRALGRGARVRAALSHAKGKSFVAALAGAASRGAGIELIVHDTERRVPERDIAALRKAGAVVNRFRHPDGLPMHAKFMLIEGRGPAAAWLGSANFNPRSRWINQEILLRATDPSVVDGLGVRFAQIAADPCNVTAEPQ